MARTVSLVAPRMLVRSSTGSPPRSVPRSMSGSHGPGSCHRCLGPHDRRSGRAVRRLAPGTGTSGGIGGKESLLTAP